MSHPVMFVSLGPGDPELVTLKALAVLRGADAVFCPAAGGGSRSAAILSALDISPARVRAFPVPMSGDRSAAAESYRRASEWVTEAWRSGLAVAVAAEG
ncbi:MAG: precorrin-2 C(20)-methyltransferase, partial [Alistipes sp.]|nr:precorrin-2 C(20)-methyltransferase [Alistipes sp.]